MATILDLSYVAPTPGNMGDWKERHMAAVNNPTRSLGGGVVMGLKAWVLYAEQHAQRFESDIGQDYVLGPAWAQWGLSLRTLLNGELGGLDGGTLDHIIYQNLKEQGYDPDTM